MPETDPRCPDCGVTMETMKLQTGGGYHLQFLSDENKGGILGKLGVNERYDGQTYVCPECGLARLYADLSES